MSQIIPLNPSEVQYLCEKEESQFFDKKAFGIEAKKIQKLAVAFANSDGGEIIVGIKDDSDEPIASKRWQGRDSTEEYNSIIKALVELEPSIPFRFSFHTKQGEVRNYILKIDVDKGTDVYYTADKKVYVRHGAQSMPYTSPIKILELSHAKGVTSAEDLFVSNYPTDELLKSPYLIDFLEKLPIRSAKPIDFLLQENLINKESLNPTFASILLFAENPSQILPKQCAIKVVRYDSTDEDISREFLTEDKFSIEGNLLNQIQQAKEKIDYCLNQTKVTTLNGDTTAKYPHNAIWEILVNAVIHRDYSISDNTLITIYNDRITFKSPGKLPGIVTPTNILDERCSRNSKVVRLINKIPNSPNQDLGEGINTAFHEMKVSGFIKPNIEEKGNYVIVTLKHALDLEPEEVILKYLSHNPSITNKKVRDLTGIQESEKVSSIFAKMREKGLIKREEKEGQQTNYWTNADTKAA